uniref:Uncharacterized protein n=1 Tax=Photinus pyralis TaxID=7054 RepID=A0A1Y1KP64_PHOPY
METHTVYVFSFAIVTLLVLETFADSFVCDIKKRYRENKCNYCACTTALKKELQFSCTKMGCPNGEYAKLRNCDPTIPSPYKNCWCFQRWGTICEIPKNNLQSYNL